MKTKQHYVNNATYYVYNVLNHLADAYKFVRKAYYMNLTLTRIGLHRSRVYHVHKKLRFSSL